MQVSSAASYLEPLKSRAIGCASKMLNFKLQMALLDQTKIVIKSMQNLMTEAKESGGNCRVSSKMLIQIPNIYGA